MVPHLLPDQAQLQALISDLPLRLHNYVDEDQLYIATLQVGVTPSIACFWQPMWQMHMQSVFGAVLQ